MDRFKVEVHPNLDGEVPPEEKLLEAALEAGWSDDPGTGHAVLVADERGQPGYEVFNPIPFAPPVGWEPTPPIDELIKQRVREEVMRLKDDDEVDDIVDAEDFDVPDDGPELSTIYEFIAMEEDGPSKRVPVVSEEERAKKDAEYAELVERFRGDSKRRARAEYEKRRAEEDALYGPSDAVQAALERSKEKGG